MNVYVLDLVHFLPLRELSVELVILVPMLSNYTDNLKFTVVILFVLRKRVVHDEWNKLSKLRTWKFSILITAKHWAESGWKPGFRLFEGEILSTSNTNFSLLITGTGHQTDYPSLIIIVKYILNRPFKSFRDLLRIISLLNT